MSLIQQLQTITGNAQLSRRKALLGLSLLALTACSRSVREIKAADSTVAYYTCTMHPFVRSQDSKGKCPVCGMDLVPVLKSSPDNSTTNAAPIIATSATDTSGIINIAPERMQEIGVATEVVAKRSLTRLLSAPARAEIDESALRDINIKAGAGYVMKLYASYEGMSFRKGQPLMTVLCEGWLQTQIDYIKAYRDWKRTPLLSPNNSFALNNKLELMRARIRIWDLSEDQIASLEKFALSTNEIDLKTGHGLSGSFDVLAPFDGYVHMKKAVEGMRFEAGQSLLQLADHNRVWIVAQFPEDQAMYLNAGQKVTVTFPSMPQQKVEGTISFIDPHVDDQQRRIMARIVISDESHMFHPGLFAQVSGEVPMGESLTISTGAVVPTGNKFIVFVDHGDGKLEPREIEIGLHSGDYDEVVSGLKEGDRIVASANFLIDAESRIQGVLKTLGRSSMKLVSSPEEPKGLIEEITDASGRNPFLIGLLCLIAVCAGFYSLKNIALDAVPDLSDVQVIVYTNWEGRSPSLIEDQITYPITSRFLGAPKVKAVRGLSMFGRSFVYVIFEDGTDLYWARSRALEYLNSVRESLPPGVTPTLGPDATGVGWVYEYALVDDAGQRNLAQLRSLQDWTLKYALGSVKGVSEVASIGGFVRQYQVNVDPNKLINHGVSLNDVVEAVRKSNNDVGGKSMEVSTVQYFIRGRGYIHSLDDLRHIPLKASDGTPLTVDQVATVEFGPDLREGLAEFNGQGEAVGGIVVMRFGENALSVINGVKKKIEQLKDSLPPGVRIVPVYDRSQLILRSIDTLKEKLIEESIIVSLVCIFFLWHFRSALVAIIMLPTAMLLSFIPFAAMHLTANIMSLGGIAIAIGAMVDAAIIMIENAHKELEHARSAKNRDLGNQERIEAILHAARKMGRPLFFSLLVITVSFVPVFTLEGQAGRLFQPLAFTKTFAMFFAALLSITLVPVLMVMLIRGRMTPEARNPLNRILIALYRPVVDWVLRARWLVVVLSLTLLALTIIPILHLGSEFMPPLNEGDILFMPTAPDGLGTQEASRILHDQNVRLKQIPEFMTVFGKAGAAETATDPAPMSMFETTIQVKPPDQWRPGMTWEGLQREIQDRVQTPGMADIIWMPIQTRTEMLTTGFRSNLGLRVYGRSLHDIADAGEQIEQALKDFPGTRSVFAERSEGGRYLDITPDREAIARYNLTVDDINQVVEIAIGGNTLGYTVEGRERYPISVRLQRDFRDSLSAIRQIPVAIPGGAQVPLSSLASIEYASGPPEVRSENGQLVTYVSVDTIARDFGGYVKQAGERLHQRVHAPPGVYWEWAGSFEQLQQVEARLLVIIPFTLLIIILLIYLNTRSFVKTCIVLLAVPFSLVGAFWLLYLCGYQFSVAVAVGLIALAGIDAETGVVMLIYLDQAYDDRVARGAMNHFNDLIAAVKEGAVQRIRPKMMTMAAILFGLLPIMWSTGSGSEVMKRIAAPMIGGVVTSAILGLLLYPVLYVLWRSRHLPRKNV